MTSTVNHNFNKALGRLHGPWCKHPLSRIVFSQVSMLVSRLNFSLYWFCHLVVSGIGFLAFNFSIFFVEDFGTYRYWRAVVYHFDFMSLIEREGRLKRWVRSWWVVLWIPHCWPTTMTINDWVFHPRILRASISGFYLSSSLWAAQW